MEGNLRFKLNWTSLWLERNLCVIIFAFFYFVFEGNLLRSLIFARAI